MSHIKLIGWALLRSIQLLATFAVLAIIPAVVFYFNNIVSSMISIVVEVFVIVYVDMLRRELLLKRILKKHQINLDKQNASDKKTNRRDSRS